jgi:hypothetical protein
VAGGDLGRNRRPRVRPMLGKGEREGTGFSDKRAHPRQRDGSVERGRVHRRRLREGVPAVLTGRGPMLLDRADALPRQERALAA